MLASDDLFPSLIELPKDVIAPDKFLGGVREPCARDFTALRDKPDPAPPLPPTSRPDLAFLFFEASWPNPIAGVLEREEQTWHEALKPTSYLITQRNAPLRRAFPPAVADAPDAELTSCCGEPSTYDVATENPWYRGDEYDDPQADADYDPETDMEEESLDIHEEAIAACFDDGGYEQE